MKIVKGLIQGSPEWLAHRASSRNASDAPAMIGVSKYKTRTQLLDERATGIVPDVDAATQRRFDEGHRVEALARAITEEELGEDLFPVIGTTDDGYLSASFDGITMDGKIIFEHKLWNQIKADAIDAQEIPETDYWQVVHQMAVSGADRCLYVVSDGTTEKRRVLDVGRDSVSRNFGALVEGWQQFDKDLAEHAPAVRESAPVADTPEDLPAVRVRVSGELTIADNFAEFGEHLHHFIDNILITDPKTDQDFADLEAQVKTLKKAEAALESAEAQLLSQVEAVDAAKRMKDQLYKLTRDNRLMAEKLIKEAKKAIKIEIATAARRAVDTHIAQINETLDGVRLPMIVSDFNAAMKGKRTVETLRSAADDEVARVKIEASQVAGRIRANLKTLADAGHAHLFADRQQLVLKAPEDLAAVIKARITDESERRQREAESIADRERERIRAEEQAKAEQAAQEDASRAQEAEAKSHMAAPQPEKAEPAPTPAFSVDAESLAIEAMQQYGGGFARALGVAWARADQDNRARLRGAFPELLAKYAGIALQASDSKEKSEEAAPF